jgi:drug/metabolite transporter (DMT)-like permease
VTLFKRSSLIFDATNKRTGLLFVCAAASVWGLIWVPMRYVESLGINALWVVAIFQILPFIALLPFCRKSLILHRADWGIYLAAGGAMGIGFALYSLGLVVGSVTKTTVLFYLTPIWSTILGSIYLAETLTKERWVAISLGLLGCILIMQMNVFDMRFTKSDLLGLLSGISWSVGSIVIGKYSKANIVNITLFQYGVGAILAGIAAVLVGMPIPDISMLISALPVAFVASVCVFLPSVLIIFRVNQYVSPGLVGIVMLSEVVVAALSSALFLGEYLDYWQWLGFIAIIATGTYIGIISSQAVTD